MINIDIVCEKGIAIYAWIAFTVLRDSILTSVKFSQFYFHYMFNEQNSKNSDLQFTRSFNPSFEYHEWFPVK